MYGSNVGFGQCGFDQYSTQKFGRTQTAKEKAFENIEHMLNSGRELTNESSNLRSTSAEIPVVVHVIHLAGEAIEQGSNISEAQILSAISALNTDFSTTGIQFCLAKRDPFGNPTDGITRDNGSVVAGYNANGIGTNEYQIKSLNYWPNDEYYNIWIVHDIVSPYSTPINGFSYFPSTVPDLIDGTVVRYDAFGTVGNLNPSSILSKTLAHETGHYLSLFHTFEGDCAAGGQCLPIDLVCPININPDTQGDWCADTDPHKRDLIDPNCNTSLANICTGGDALSFINNYDELFI